MYKCFTWSEKITFYFYLDNLTFLSVPNLKNILECTYDSNSNPVLKTCFIQDLLKLLRENLKINKELVDQGKIFFSYLKETYVEGSCGNCWDCKVCNNIECCCTLQIPAVHLIGNIVWFPTEFLLSKMPQVDKILDRKAKDSVTSTRTSWLTQRQQLLTK